MGIKTAYRQKPAEEIPAASEKMIDSEPATDAVLVNPAAAEAIAKASVKDDEATARLKRQLHDLQHSEQLQRQTAAARAQPQVSPEWRAFLEANPQLEQNFHLAYAAAAQAHEEGHQVNSRAQMERTLEL